MGVKRLSRLKLADPATTDIIRNQADMALIKPYGCIQLRDFAVWLRPSGAAA
jgi:hypothetical protein